MNTPRHPLLLVTLALGAFTLAGCSKEQPAKAEPAAAPEPAKPQTVSITTGKIAFAGMDAVDPTQVEVIVLEKLSPELIMLMSEQHDCYADLLAPPPEPEPEDSTATTTEAQQDEGLAMLSERDRKRLESMLTDLKSEVPARMKSDFTVNRTARSFESRESLYNRYAKPIDSLTLENMVGVLNQIGENMRADYDLLVKETKSGDEQRAFQAQADINWMAALSDYMKDYQRLVRRYDSLRRRAILRDARKQRYSQTTSTTTQQNASPEKAFDRFQMDNAMNLEVLCYKDAIATAFANPDGTFKVEGQGILVARINDEHHRPLLFRQGTKEPTIEFTDLSQSEKTVQPK